MTSDPNNAIVYNPPSPLGHNGHAAHSLDIHPPCCWCGSPHPPDEHPKAPSVTTIAEVADRLQCHYVTVLRYVMILRDTPPRAIRGRPVNADVIRLTPTEQRIITAWHHLAQTKAPEGGTPRRGSIIDTLRRNARDAIETDPTGDWLVLDLDSAHTTHDPTAAALNYHNPNRYPTRALWLIPLAA